MLNFHFLFTLLFTKVKKNLSNYNVEKKERKKRLKMPAAKAMGAAKKAAVKVDHKGRVFTYVLAQMASAAPPLGM